MSFEEITLVVHVPRPGEDWEIEIPELDGTEFAKVFCANKWEAWKQAQEYAEDLYAEIEP